MLKLIFKVKKTEIIDVLESLLIGSSHNKVFFKYLVMLILFLAMLVLVFFPNPLLYLYNSMNLTFFDLNFNVIFFVLLITIISGNKSILKAMSSDIVSFYQRNYVFYFYYLKEKIIISPIFTDYKWEFLILDEPFEHLDMDTCSLLKEKIVETDASVLIINHKEHILDDMQLERVKI